MNWDDPQARAELIGRVGPDEYNRLFSEHQRSTVIETVNGHDISPKNTPFGRLFAVGNTRRAFKTLEQAKAFAGKEPAT